jgi:hypothetical protein
MGVLAVAGQKVPASFPNQYYGAADTTSIAVTAATQTALTTSYSIPANEPAAGSAYELSFGGSGTWGATQQSLAFTLVVGGVVVLNNIILGAQAFSASAAFRFAGRALIVWDSVGATGKLVSEYLINLTQTANNVAPPGTYTQGNFQAAATYGLADANGALSAAIDTTTSTAVVVKCAWNSTTGAPTITNRHTRFAKVA